MNKKEKCVFSIVDFPNDGEMKGEFISDVPKKAAIQAFSYLAEVSDIYKNNEDSLGKFIVFVIKNKNNGKLYKYIGNRVKLENVIKIKKNGNYIEYKYKDVVGKYKEELNKIK